MSGTSQSITLSDENAVKQTAVIGGGPGGLVNCLYMLMKGHNVTLFEKRIAPDDKVRNNAVFLQEQETKIMLKDFTKFYECGYEIEYVFKLNKLEIKIRHDQKVADKYAKEASELGKSAPSLSEADLTFINILHTRQGNIRIKEYQNYVQSKIDAYCAAHPEKTFNKVENEISEVNPTVGAVGYKDGNEIKWDAFNNIIISEGASRILTTKVFGKDNEQKLKSADFNPCAHAVGYIDVDKVDQELFSKYCNSKPLCSPFLPLTINLRRKNVPLFSKLGWNYPDLPNFYLRAEEDKQRFYFACEIPVAMQQSKQDKTEINKQLSDWLKIAIAKEYPGLNQDKLKLVTEGVDKAQTFSKSPTQLKSGYMGNNNAHIFIIADALIQSAYKLGSGTYLGVLTGRGCSECYGSNGAFKTEKPFTEAMAVSVRSYNFLLKLFTISKKLQEHSIKTRLIALPLINRKEGLKWFFRKVTRPQLTKVEDIVNHAKSDTRPKKKL